MVMMMMMMMMMMLRIIIITIIIMMTNRKGRVRRKGRIVKTEISKQTNKQLTTKKRQATCLSPALDKVSNPGSAVCEEK